MHVNKTSSIFIIAHYIQGLQYRLLKIFFRERRKGITFKSLSKQCITSDKKHSSSSNFCIINLYHFCVVHDLVLNIIIEKSLGSEMLWITFRYSWHFPNRKKDQINFVFFALWLTTQISWESRCQVAQNEMRCDEEEKIYFHLSQKYFYSKSRYILHWPPLLFTSPNFFCIQKFFPMFPKF